MLVGWVTDPIESGVVSYALVHRIDHNDFVPFVHGILSYPIGVQDSQGTHFSSDPFLSDGFQVSASLDLLNTVGGWLTVADTLANFSLSSTSLDSYSIDAYSLLGFVSKTTSFVWACWI